MSAETSILERSLINPGEVARREIQRFVRERLLGRKIDIVTFMEELLAITTQVGAVTCRPIESHALRFEVPETEPFDVELDRNHAKLRILCARLAVLCAEDGQQPMIFGGQGRIHRTAHIESVRGDSEPLYHLAWNALWSNTPDKHEFTISVMR